MPALYGARGRRARAAPRTRRPGTLAGVAWNDGCLPRPPVGEGARAVTFPWAEADALGAALAVARPAVMANLETRADAVALLVDWEGGHRREFDAERTDHEAVLAADGLGSALATLRRAWDDAAELQTAENARAPSPDGDPPC